MKTAPNYGFGSESRKDIGANNPGPGPGGYQLNQIIGNDGPKNSMHATIDYKPEKKENAYKPGPGQYNDNYRNVKNKSPGWKVGTGTRSDLGT